MSRRDAADAERGDADGGRDGVDHRADHRRGRADREEDHDRHQVGEGRDDLHRVERGRDRRGARAGCGRPRSPIGMPIDERERDRGEHQRERLDARLPQPHQRERGERGEHDERRPPAAEAEHDQRAATMTPSHVIHSSASVNALTSHSAIARKASRIEKMMFGSVAERWSISQPWKSSSSSGSADQTSAARPRDLAARDHEGQQHEREHAQHLHGAAAPPPGGRRDRRRGDAAR